MDVRGNIANGRPREKGEQETKYFVAVGEAESSVENTFHGVRKKIDILRCMIHGCDHIKTTRFKSNTNGLIVN